MSASHSHMPVSTMQARAHQLAELQNELAQHTFAQGLTGEEAESIHAVLLRGACRIFECKAGGLTLLDQPEDGLMVSKLLAADEPDHAWTYQIMPVAGPGLGRLALSGASLLNAGQGAADPRFDPASDGWGEYAVHNLVIVPLIVAGQPFGLLRLLNTHQGAFSAFDEDLLRILAAQAAGLLHSTRIVQQLKVTNADLEANRWELFNSRNVLRALFDHLPTSLYIINPAYTLEAVNQSRSQRLEQAPRLLVGQTCYTALFGRSTPCEECRVRETFEDGRSTQRAERRYAADESASDWEISSHPIPDEHNRVVQAILVEHDVSERRRLEAVLTQSEKLAAIGQLAAGVAHEINNPLTAIIANAQMLQRELPQHSDLQESVELITRAGARAAQVVRNLLDFARKEEVHLTLTDTNQTIERALELIQHELLSRGVQLQFLPDRSLPPILASQDQLQSVWLNLLLNGIDAMDKTPALVKIATQKVGGEIHVVVSDNGKGIPPDRLMRIFEPFYTTKVLGRGTGLGLSVSDRIVKQHGGRIGVESQLGAGSTFTVTLPTS